MTQQEIYKQAIEKYGTESRICLAKEVMDELSNTLTELQGGRIFLRELFDEIANVRIAMEQLSILFGEEEVQQQIDYKTNKLKSCLEKDDNGKTIIQIGEIKKGQKFFIIDEECLSKFGITKDDVFFAHTDFNNKIQNLCVGDKIIIVLPTTEVCVLKE